MPIKYKIDIIKALKDAGYSTFRIRKEHLIPEYTLQMIRQGKLIPWNKLEVICELLNCQPGDIVFYEKEE